MSSLQRELQEYLLQPCAHTWPLLLKCDPPHCENTAGAHRLSSSSCLLLQFLSLFYLIARRGGEGLTMQMNEFRLLLLMASPIQTGGHNSGSRTAQFPQGQVLRGVTQSCESPLMPLELLYFSQSLNCDSHSSTAPTQSRELRLYPTCTERINFWNNNCIVVN